MADKKISYLARNFDDYRNAIVDMSRKYYGEVFENFNDGSVGSWLIDVFADIADNLSYNIDRAYQETSIDSANMGSSLRNIARTQGVKVPGKKAALVEAELSCELPLAAASYTDSTGDQSIGDERYAPYIKRGTLFSTGMYTFELMEDVDFSKQFNSSGLPDRQIIPNRDSNGNITSYTYRKLGLAAAGQSKIYKKVVYDSDVKPFMSIDIPDRDILNVESIIVKDGSDINSDPPIEEFYVDEEAFIGRDGKTVQRFFEVDDLSEQYRFGYETELNGDGYYNPVWTDDMFDSLYDDNGNLLVDETGKNITVPARRVAKGLWKRFKNKFITEFNDNWTMKVTFGKGLRNIYGEIPGSASEFTKYMMSRMEANDYMGVLPESGSTIYVLYRFGGGAMTNIAPGTLKHITYLNMVIAGDCASQSQYEDAVIKRNVQASLRVTNRTPSYGGKDVPTAEELRYLVKYNTSAQNRCVTLKDYQGMLNKIHPMYGCPFRTGVTEENNKIVIYTLGLDNLGNLKTALSTAVENNMKAFLSNYRMINDFVEVRSGYVINVGFEVNIYAERAYDNSEVAKRVIDLVYDYMDIRRHIMGEDIFLGDLEKEISKLDGVQNLISLKCFNMHGKENGYSDTETTQTTVTTGTCEESEYFEDMDGMAQIDLKESDKVLYCECNSMFEVKYKNKDIVVNVKQRG